MYCTSKFFTYLIYWIALNGFGIFVRYLALESYFEYFDFRETNLREQRYDYVVVGGGPAGCIVAHRLSADKNTTVLLIEAGGRGNSLLDIPSMGALLQNTIFDWQYRTVPQKQACLALDNKVSSWPRGKILGGSGQLNNMIYIRGHPEDFKRWYRDQPGFNYDIDILPYFQKLENVDTDNHKSSLILSDLPFSSNISESFLRAAADLGLPTFDGFDTKLGFSVPMVSMRKGQRWTPCHQLKASKRSNLIVRTNSVVENVLLRHNYEAYGVKYYSNLGKRLYAGAKNGVILSAGVIGTPKILMLSGVGPKGHLQKVMIEPKIDLPVGENLQDHVTTGPDLILLNSSIHPGLGHLLSPYSAWQYLFMSGGPLTSNACDSIAFYCIKENIPDLQLMVLPLSITFDGGIHLRHFAGIGDRLWDSYFSKIDKTSITVLPVVLHPKSRGTVRLADKNPDSPPVIDPNYLSDTYDVEMLLHGIEIVKTLVRSEPLQKLGADINTNVLPGCERWEFDTKNYWECYVRHLTLTSYHPVGTCKLGEVTNYDFQVKGTNKLYVVDGSVLPDLPSGNPMAAIMMMAEKAADVIKHHRWLNEQTSAKVEIFVKNLVC